MVDSDTYRWFERLPPESERLRWCEWMRQHGVDPNDARAVKELRLAATR